MLNPIPLKSLIPSNLFLNIETPSILMTKDELYGIAHNIVTSAEIYGESISNIKMEDSEKRYYDDDRSEAIEYAMNLLLRDNPITIEIESITFIIEKLKELSLKYKDSRIRYEYIVRTRLHLIETKPYDLYDNEEYLKDEEKFEKEFEEKFPNERFLLMGESSLYEIDNPIAIFNLD